MTSSTRRPSTQGATSPVAAAATSSVPAVTLSPGSRANSARRAAQVCRAVAVGSSRLASTPIVVDSRSPQDLLPVAGVAGEQLLVQSPRRRPAHGRSRPPGP